MTAAAPTLAKSDLTASDLAGTNAPADARAQTKAHSQDRADESVRRRGALRFITCGSVDDGKSTLIGRLLFEARAIFEDQEAALVADSRKFGTTGEDADYALLVDGLEAEREQGITIDVAYRFFTTPKRAFIVADTPGHQQYTRNMATGASGADLAILLVDARKGLLDQTRRHAAIVSLLGIHKVVLAVNKMDLVGFDRNVFDAIEADFRAVATRMDFDVVAIPVAARHGDNVAARSDRMPWHQGPTLLDYLETVETEDDTQRLPFRFPVQWVNRPNADFRGFAGTVESGTVAVGDEIVVAGSGRRARVQTIVTMDGDLPRAARGDAVTLVLDDQIDVGRGDILADPKRRPDVARSFSAHLVTMADAGIAPGDRFLLKANSRTVSARVARIDYRTDVATLESQPAATLAMNDIARVQIEAVAPLAFDSYADNRATGAFILINPETNETAAAGMVVAALGVRDVYAQDADITSEARAHAKNQAPLAVWLTGLSGSGKSTIASMAERILYAEGFHATILDGDNLRLGLNSDLGFSAQERAENVRRAGEVAKLMTEAGLIVFCAFVSPFAADRDRVRAMFPERRFMEVFVDAPLDVCRSRDTKGLYTKAAEGRVTQMTGVSQPYERPKRPDLVLSTATDDARACAEKLVAAIRAYLRESFVTSLDSAQL